MGPDCCQYLKNLLLWKDVSGCHVSLNEYRTCSMCQVCFGEGFTLPGDESLKAFRTKSLLCSFLIWLEEATVIFKILIDVECLIASKFWPLACSTRRRRTPTKPWSRRSTFCESSAQRMKWSCYTARWQWQVVHTSLKKWQILQKTSPGGPPNYLDSYFFYYDITILWLWFLAGCWAAKRHRNDGARNC